MDVLADTVAWFADADQWTGDRGIPARLLQHLWLSVSATVLAAVVALPPALLLAHRRRAEFLANTVANVGRAIPSFGLVVVLAVVWITQGWSIVYWPIVLAMLLLAVPPMFINAYTGIAAVDPALVEAGRGMGYTELQVLWQIELPAAVAVILAGIRISFVQVVATVALGAVVQGRTGGLGVYIVSGFAQGPSGEAQVLAGALLVAGLTLLCERGFVLAERRLLPRGLRPAAGRADTVVVS